MWELKLIVNFDIKKSFGNCCFLVSLFSARIVFAKTSCKAAPKDLLPSNFRQTTKIIQWCCDFWFDNHFLYISTYYLWRIIVCIVCKILVVTENKPHSEDVSNSPRIKPTRITNRISSKELYARFICFLFMVWKGTMY